MAGKALKQAEGAVIPAYVVTAVHLRFKNLSASDVRKQDTESTKQDSQALTETEAANTEPT